MKKNVGLKIAIVALVAALLATCCFGAVTFARYITNGGGGAVNTAQVAKWGVKVNVDAGANGFANVQDVGYIEAAAETYELVAPGMKEAQMASVSLSGQPEVAVEVSFTGTVTFSENWVDANDDYYCPLVVTIGGTPYRGLEYDSISAFKAALETALATGNAKIDPNTNLSTYSASNVKVKWDDENADNVKDTFLGDKAAGVYDEGVASPATISITLNGTVQQYLTPVAP